MKKLIVIPVAFAALSCSTLNMDMVTSATGKLVQAVTLTDEQIDAYTTQFIVENDKKNAIAVGNDPYAVRMNRIASKINGKEGINIKVYKTKDVNAFACSDGSVRVYSGLMDIMTDEEVLGVIGHEIGHVKNKDTKDAFKNALLTSAARDALTSTGGTIAVLSASQLGDIGEAYMSARYSQKQEYAADSYGYEFLKKNGINPWAMALSFEKLQALEGSAAAKSDAMQQLFSTHPDIASRTKKMADRATADGYARPANTKK